MWFQVVEGQYQYQQFESNVDVALNYVQETVSKGGSILFVGTKRQAQKPISEAAERSAQYYMNYRWLGGTLTNWKTVSNSISRLKKLDEQLSDGATGLTKKERLNLEREQSKLNASLGGIREMGGTPDLLFVIDTNKEALAIQEAKKLGIPVIAIVDTNSDPSFIDYPIPGNDDAARSISLYCDLVAKAALEGMTNQLTTAGVDIGASIDPINEEIQSNNNKNKNIQKTTKENLESPSEIIPNNDNLEDINIDNTNLVGNDIVEKKENLAAENISDDVKISDTSDNSRKESSSKVIKSVKTSNTSNTSNTLKKEEKVKKKE